MSEQARMGLSSDEHLTLQRRSEVRGPKQIKGESITRNARHLTGPGFTNTRSVSGIWGGVNTDRVSDVKR